jgi:hypothetical protein
VTNAMIFERIDQLRVLIRLRPRVGSFRRGGGLEWVRPRTPPRGYGKPSIASTSAMRRFVDSVLIVQGLCLWLITICMVVVATQQWTLAI